MSVQLRLISLSALLLLAFATASSQGMPGPVPPSPTIHLNVFAGDKKGVPSPGLTQADFALTDNGAAVPIRAFHAADPAAEPVRVILILDAVNTRFTEVAYEQTQLQKFLKANGGKLSCPTSLAVITDTGTQSEKAFTTDGNALSASLDHYSAGLRDLRRNTGIWGADERLTISLNALRGLTTYAKSLPGRKILIWLSPGWPLLSGPGIQLTNKEQTRIFADVISFSTQLREANVTLYSVNPLGAEENLMRADFYLQFVKGISSPGNTDLGDLALQVLALQSGGLALQGSTDVSAMIGRCYNELQSWYEMEFDKPPSEAAAVYHHIGVKLDKPGISAQTRDGYYTRP